MTAPNPKIGRTLIIQPLPGIGDTVWHIPFVRAIAASEGSHAVDLLTIKRSMADQLFATDPCVSDVLWLDDSLAGKGRLAGIWALAKKLRARRYQRVWILHKSYRWALVAWLAGIPERLGYGIGWQRWFLNRGKKLAESGEKHHPIDQAIQLLRLNGIPLADAVPRIVVAPEMGALAKARVQAHAAPWVAFGIGATDPRRQWNAQSFAALAERMMEQQAGTIFLIGGPADVELAEQIKRTVAPEFTSVLVAVIASPIAEAAALLSLCKLFVGNDSGMLHISAAVGTPSIGLFGVKYKKIDTHRLADESRNIFAVFPSDAAGEVNVSYMDKIAVASVAAKAELLMAGEGPSS